MKQSIFPPIDCDCDPDGHLKCGIEEHALRLICADVWPHGPMTSEQREWCIEEANRAGEGFWNRDKLAELNDQDLAKAVLHAWMDYVQSHCL